MILKINRNRIVICFFISFLFFLGNSFFLGNYIFANEINHLVISEIRISGETVYDEFIELYNPTNQEINLEYWDLKRKTKSGSESNILNNIKGIIPAYGYFLIIPRANCGENKTESCYQGAVIADDEYTTNSFLAKDNTVLLYDNNENLINKVGWGEAIDFESEVINIDFENGQSIERKVINKNIQDTANNRDDFILQSNSNPQNSAIFKKQVDNEKNNDDVQVEDSNFGQDAIEGDEEINFDFSQENDKVIISEFLSNPEDSDRDNEFIEIYNNGEKEVDLSGWILEDKIGRVKKFVFPNETKIGIGKYLVFYSDETKITLNNSGDGVLLKDKSGKFKDESLVSPAVQEDQSFALNEKDIWCLTLKPTPWRENIIEAQEINNFKNDNVKYSDNLDFQEKDSEIINNDKKDDFIQDDVIEVNYDYSDKIIISEIYPNPFGRDNREGSSEWIELYNDSDEDVNLNGWKIDDILRKGSKEYIIDNQIIKARSFKVFENIQTKIMLNNSGDEVNILWVDGEVVDKVRYEKASEGFSYNFVLDSWAWGEKLTPGSNNKIEEIKIENVLGKDKLKNNLEQSIILWEEEEGETEDNYFEADLKDFEYFTKYARVKIMGIVSAPPGIFANNIFYLLGEGSGIQIYSSDIKIPKIEMGDKIEIIGRISEIGGESRILLDDKKDVEIISSNNLVESKIISINKINKDTEGLLVTIEGKVSQIKKDVFFLSDDSGEIKIYIKPQTGIKKPKIEVGNWMVITGQVSQTSAGYRILPRFQGDLKLSRVFGETKEVKASECSGNIQANQKEQKNVNLIFYDILIMVSFLIFIDWIKIKLFKSK